MVGPVPGRRCGPVVAGAAEKNVCTDVAVPSERCKDDGVGLQASKLVGRGLMRRCPVCGSGHLFRYWFAMRTACPGCGLVFRRAPGQWLGSWFLNIVLVQVVLVVGISGLVAATWPARLSWFAIGAVVAVAVMVPMVTFPFSRTLWMAIDLIMRPLDFDDGVAPGVELEQSERRRRHTPKCPLPKDPRGGHDH